MNAARPRADAVEARRWRLGGRVQGVGFRPFVYRTAVRCNVTGWVQNRLGDVEVLAQGAAGDLARFGHELVHRAPPLARPEVLGCEPLLPDPALDGFRIRDSEAGAEPRIHVPPDCFTCEDCLAELNDPGERRYRYPFINCTQCGPRYTLIEDLPYDRANTAMRGFALCAECRREYEDPLDRRFHAEPVACPACGPVPVLEPGGHAGGNALDACLQVLRGGGIVAVKGIGGYHLVCDAASDEAVGKLRERKPRPHKPLAVMFPAAGADGLDAVRAAARLQPEEAALLRDPLRPIVVVARAAGARLSALVAPRLDEIGVMLPYSPLHHLLLADFGAPLVATSGNVSGEPVLTDGGDVDRRLARVVDAALHHDRPIVRPADDPVFRRVAGRVRPVRLGRGCAPLEIDLDFALPRPVLAVGAHMKNTVALAWESRAVVSPHIGDMDTPRGMEVFERLVQDLQSLYRVRAAAVACDAHPGYATTRRARRLGLPVTSVLHHHAHASALAGEVPHPGERLVFTWDGVGYGGDGTLWGGEALLGRPGAWRRVARLRPFRLPGGERAAREPWRSALGLCLEAGLAWPGCPEDATLPEQAWRRGVNAPWTSAAGRLFDAAAALTGVNLRSTFEGQGPMWLEASSDHGAGALELPLRETPDGLLETDWQPLVPVLLDTGTAPWIRAGIFHATLAQALLAQALAVRGRSGVAAAGLCGGVFQNRLLTERCVGLLAGHGFDVQLPARLPVNDAAISFGQLVEHAARTAASGSVGGET